jgi:malate dehydrogenase
MAEIGIIGSGNVGANTAFFLAERGVADTLLYDVKEGLARGKALDMMEAAPIRGYVSRISGTDSFDDLMRCDILVVTAGAVRTPGMKREDLFATNRGVIAQIAAKLRGSPARVIVVTEPVDALTTLFVRQSGLPWQRVMGLGGSLDSTRLRYLIATALGVSTENVDATVIGRHSDAMIPLGRYSTVSGVPVTLLLPQDRLDVLYRVTRGAGDLIVDMAQRASAYYGPSAVAADLAEAVHRDSRRIIPVSLVFHGQYGIEGAAMSLPAVIGAGGIERVLEPRLTDRELAALKDSAAVVLRGLEGERVA